MKTCTTCGISKPVSEYHFANRKFPHKSGPEALCKACRSEKSKKRRQTPEYRQAHREYWRNKQIDPVKLRARQVLRQAVLSKRINKPELCEECGSGGEIQGHHEDYSKPLEVNWLCAKCHGGRHRKDIAA